MGYHNQGFILPRTECLDDILHQPAVTHIHVLSSVFQALGNGVFSLIVSVCRQLFVLLPAAWLLAQTGNVNNVWWAFLIAEIVSVLLSLGFYARINKNIIAPMYSPAE